VATWSIEAARSVADGVVLVVPDPDLGLGTNLTGADRTVIGGDSRAASVRAGLAAVPDGVPIIVVHDAVRPLAAGALFASVVDVVQSGGADGAIPVLAVTDTLKRVSGGTLGGIVHSTIDRNGLVTVQTPQAFDGATLRAAHRKDGVTTDDAGLLERLGATVRTVPGDPRNLKITEPGDLEVAEALLRAVHG